MELQVWGYTASLLHRRMRGANITTQEIPRLDFKKTKQKHENLRLRHMLQHNKLQRSHRGYSRPRCSWQLCKVTIRVDTLLLDIWLLSSLSQRHKMSRSNCNRPVHPGPMPLSANPERDPSNEGWFCACLVFGHVLWKVRGKPGQQILRCSVHKPRQSPTIFNSCGCLTYWTLHCFDLLEASGSRFRCTKDRHCFAPKLVTKTRRQVQTWCILHLVSWQALLGGKQANKR